MLSLSNDRCSAVLLLLQVTILGSAAGKTGFLKKELPTLLGRVRLSSPMHQAQWALTCRPAALCREAVRASDKENIPKWLQKELPPPPRRERLPSPKQREKSVSLWSIIKECVGKDLSRVCLPVFFNEPLSSLQRIAEEMEYSELLDEVCTRTFCPVIH